MRPPNGGGAAVALRPVLPAIPVMMIVVPEAPNGGSIIRVQAMVPIVVPEAPNGAVIIGEQATVPIVVPEAPVWTTVIGIRNRRVIAIVAVVVIRSGQRTTNYGSCRKAESYSTPSPAAAMPAAMPAPVGGLRGGR